MSISYTYFEQTVRKYTQEDAKKAARFILDEKKVRFACVDALKNAPLLMTLPELNDLVTRLVDDSVYYA